MYSCNNLTTHGKCVIFSSIEKGKLKSLQASVECSKILFSLIIHSALLRK